MVPQSFKPCSFQALVFLSIQTSAFHPALKLLHTGRPISYLPILFLLYPSQCHKMDL